MRTSVQRAVGGYDPACFHASDLNMWLRIAAVSDIAYVRGVPQAIYRIHPDSMLRGQDAVMGDLRRAPGGVRLVLRAASRPAGRRAGELRRDGESRALARQALWRASRAIDRDVDGPTRCRSTSSSRSLSTSYPDARRLREWHGLQTAPPLGAGRSRWFPPFVATGAAHRLRSHADRLRWRLKGV